MIKTLEDLNRYLQTDKEVYLEGKRDSFLYRFGDMRRFYRTLRYCEYHYKYGNKFCFLFWEYHYRKIGKQLG